MIVVFNCCFFVYKFVKDMRGYSVALQPFEKRAALMS